ncbi:MAG: NTP transferase domain-containing protein, partial [Magnetospirillum sp.]|nr:NTP transferase domain-containing protein [Magnetospirillum sp.]
MSFFPKHAMVLAAGLGMRMRPITEHTPKPLIAVDGRTMLDRALDHLDAAGATDLVVNTHWLAHRIEAHLADRPGITLSHEDVLLETGGGVTKALPYLGTAPFYVVNSDIIWTDGAIPALRRLAEFWDD